MPDAATQAQIQAAGDTIQVIPRPTSPYAPAGTSAPAPNAPGTTFGSSAFQTKPTNTLNGVVSPLNPAEYGTQSGAAQIAQMFFGTPVQLPNTFTGPGASSPTQWGVKIGGTTYNAGLLADSINRYGASYVADQICKEPNQANPLGNPNAPGVPFTPPAGAPPQAPPVPPKTAAPVLPPSGTASMPVATPSDGGGGVAGNPYDPNRIAGNTYMPPAGPSYPPFPPATGPGLAGPSGGPNPVLPGSTGSMPPPTLPGSTVGNVNVGTPPPIGPYTGSTTYPTLPGGYPGPQVGTGDKNLAAELESQRQIALSGGTGLQDQFASYTAANLARTKALQDQLAGIYNPLLEGKGGYNPTETAAIEGNPQAGVQAFQQGAAGMDTAVAGEGAAVNNALGTGAANVNQYIDPNQLTWTPEMTEAMVNQAARSVGANTQAEEDAIRRNAVAAGNVTPQALAAMEDRARLTGEVNSADTMANARLAAQQARLSAAQAYANLGAQNAQQTAQRNTGAQLELGAQGIGAKQYETGLGTSAAQTAEGEASQRGTTVANQEQGQAAEARNNYLGGQESQANQGAQVGQQQQTGAYTATTSGSNQAGGLQVENKAVNQNNPGSIPNVIFGHEKGATIEGPQLSLVGEKPDPQSPTGYAPEAIIKVGPPRYGMGGVAIPHVGSAPRLPHFAAGPAPRYGISPSSMPRMMTRSGFQRILPRFEDGGIVEPVPMADGGTVDTDPPWLRLAKQYAQSRGGLMGLAANLAEAYKKDKSKDQGTSGSQGKKPPFGSGPSADTPKTDTGIPRSPGVEADTAQYQGTTLPWIFRDNPYPATHDALTFSPRPSSPLPIPKLGMPRGGTAKQNPPTNTPPQINIGQQHLPPPPPIGGSGGGGGATHEGNSSSTIQFGGEVPDPTAPPPPGEVMPTPPGTLNPDVGSTIRYGGEVPTDPSVGGLPAPGNDPINYPGWTPDPGLQNPGVTDPSIGVSYGQLPTDPNAGGTGENLPITTPDPGSGGDIVGGGGAGLGGGYFGGGDFGGYYGSDPGGPPPEFNAGEARGGVFAPRSRPGERLFTPPKSTRYGKTEIVDHPTVMELGKRQPEAVMPLKKGAPGARVRPTDIPKLERRYAAR